MTSPSAIGAGHRVVISPEQWDEMEIGVAGEDHHHLCNVLRVRVGNRVGVTDGKGRIGTAEVTRITPSHVFIRILDYSTVPPPRLRVELFVGIIREQQMDLLIAFATALGVWRIIPLICERSVIRLPPEKVRERMDRWQRIVASAIRQSGRAWIPQLDAPCRVSAATHYASSAATRWVASPHPSSRNLKLLIPKLHQRIPANTVSPSQAAEQPHSLAIFIGPEGDFCPPELEALLQTGAVPISLGPYVLRTELAVAYVLSVLQYEFGL